MGVTSRKKAELVSYQLIDVSQIWYTQWKDNRPEESGPIEWEEFKEAFLGKYFHREKMEVKVEEFININKGHMNVKEYFLKFSKQYKYAPSLVSNPRDEMSRFVMGLPNSVIEECCIVILHDDMTLDRLMVYDQSIEESKLRRMSISLKSCVSSDSDQTRFKKRAQTQEEPKSVKVKLEKGGVSQNVKYPCVICGKRHYGECLKGTESFFLLW